MKFGTINKRKEWKPLSKFHEPQSSLYNHEIFLQMEIKYSVETGFIIYKDKGKTLLPYIPNEWANLWFDLVFLITNNDLAHISYVWNKATQRTTEMRLNYTRVSLV